MNETQTSTDETLEIRLLGGVEIRRNGTIVEGFASSKAHALLAYLACKEGVHKREHLATMLWDDRPQDRALGNLRVVISSIRKLLGPFVVATRQTIALRLAENVWIDTVALEHALSATLSQIHARASLSPQNVSSLERVLLLYRGEFLAGFFIRSANDYDAWATFERERLQHGVVTCMDAITDHFIEQQMYDQGISWAKRLIQLEPLHERGHQQLLQLLASSNRRNAAIAHFGQYRQMLAEEMGIDPSADTLALYDQLLNGEAIVGIAGRLKKWEREGQRLPSTVQPELPVALTSIVGREQELTEIIDLLASSECRLLTLLGPGGIGKTRLSVAVARRLSDDRSLGPFDDGIYFVPLETITEPTSIITAIASALSITLDEKAAAIPQVKAYLRRRHTLLVLDNLEHLLDGVDPLLTMLEAAPHLKMLVTSREHLDFHGERLFELGGLEYPPDRPAGSQSTAFADNQCKNASRDTGQEASAYAAIRLFVREATALNSSFDLDEDCQAVVELCQEVDGFPLAIQLAAASVRLFSPRQVLTQIRQNLDFLQTTMRNIPTRHRTLRAVFEHSWQLLPQAERNAFRQLAIFPSSFSQDASERVAGITGPMLLSLINSSLIERIPGGQARPTRYRLHAVLRQYAAQKLADEPVTMQTVQQRHAAYFVAFLEECLAGEAGEPADASGGLRLDDIGLELDNCRAAWQWAIHHQQWHLAQRSLPALSRYYLLHGPFREGSSTFQIALDALRLPSADSTEAIDTRRSLLGRLLAIQASLFNRQAAYDEALTVALETVSRATEAEMVEIRVEGHLAAAQAYRFLGDFAATNRHAEEALTLARGNGMGVQEADSLLALGTVRLYEGAYSSARNALSNALTLFREIASPQNESRTLNVMGNLALYEGLYSRARNYYEQSLRLYQRLGDRQGEAQVYNNLGAIHFHIGDFGTAQSYYEQAMTVEQAIGGMQGISLISSNLSLLSQHQGDFALGLTHAISAQVIAQELGLRDSLAFAQLCVGHAYVGLEAWSEAYDAYAQSLRLRRALGQENQALESRAGLVHVALATNLHEAILSEANEIVSELHGNNLLGIVEPFRIYWTCYLALSTLDEVKASAILQEAYILLRQRTESFVSALQRHTYINNMPARRALVAEYLNRGQRQGSPAP